MYDIAKKSAVHQNAVPPVLLLNVLTAAAIWSIALLAPFVLPTDFVSSVPEFTEPLKRASQIGLQTHLLMFCKSMLVGASWTCAFFAMKHLPISIATPIRASSPLWTILFAVGFMGERPGVMQWLGIIVVLSAFFVFSRVGAIEGIHFHRDRWVALMVIATLLGAASALYDKYLLQHASLSPSVVQAWFSIYLVPVMMPLTIRWYRRERKTNRFQWRWSIPMIALLLLVADFAYFTAITDEHAMIAVISPIRRTSIIISFLYGIVRLKEQNWRAKGPCIVAVVIGVALLSWPAPT
tara:strand:+ start:58612 stop:59496 length:885 start_codon:yes stop_codon:yes gene_type:complete